MPFLDSTCWGLWRFRRLWVLMGGGPDPGCCFQAGSGGRGRPPIRLLKTRVDRTALQLCGWHPGPNRHAFHRETRPGRGGEQLGPRGRAGSQPAFPPPAAVPFPGGAGAAMAATLLPSGGRGGRRGRAPDEAAGPSAGWRGARQAGRVPAAPAPRRAREPAAPPPAAGSQRRRPEPAGTSDVGHRVTGPAGS